MRLESLRIANFRACADVTVRLDPYTCLVGPNGAGKSTVLAALNILFHHGSGTHVDVVALGLEDFCDKDVSKPIEIEATFCDLSEAATADLAEYVRQGKLVIKARAVWDQKRASAPVKQYGARFVMKELAPYFEADKSGAKAPELKALFGELRAAYPDIKAASSKADMGAALRAYEDAHPDLCELCDSEDQFYGISRGANRLANHVQWVYVPAVKDAATEQLEGRDTALGELLQRTIRSDLNFDEALSSLRGDTITKYQEIVHEKDQALAELEGRLEGTLRRWAHPGARVELRWDTESEKAVAVNAPFARVRIGEGNFIGEVPRLGHGMQRAFIVAMLQQLSTSDSSGGPTLILGFEEPELYQHPPQARHLAGVLEELATGNAQVLVTTHSPYFISGRGFEAVRMFRKPDGGTRTRCSSATLQEVSEKLALALGKL